jgi:hypothetical protein
VKRTGLFTFKQNKEMKTITRLLGLFAIVAMFIFLDACKGEKGDIGPAGATGAIGPTGVTGATGPAGATGNANVIQYTYTTARLASSGEISYAVTGITQTQLNNSLVFVYALTTLNPTVWYALPGYTSGGSNQYRVYMNSTALNVYITRSVGSTTETFNSVRILVIPANDLRTGRQAAVDYTDYEAVKKYYNLKD